MDRTASLEAIKDAYRRLVHVYHPDINHDADAEPRTREINAAYDLLTDDIYRQRYTTSTARPRRKPWVSRVTDIGSPRPPRTL
mgnify:CR=1 FL=1